MTKQNTYRSRTVICTLSAALIVVALLSLIFAQVFTQKANAVASTYLNFQARLMNGSGATVPDGNYNVEFKLYDAETGGSMLWSESYTGADRLRVANGYLTANLGSETAFGSSIDWTQKLWLTMNIGDTSLSPDWDGEMDPRLLLTAIPHAFLADTARGVASANTSSGSTNSNNVVVQSGNATGSTSNSGNISIDAGTATGTTGTISLGATNASSLLLGRAGFDTKVVGTATVQGGTLSVGGSSQSGTLTLYDSDSGSETVSLQGGAISSSYNLILPTAVGLTDQCLKTDSVTATQLVFGSCAASGGDAVYVNASAATDANFINTTATGTAAGVTFTLNTATSPDEISITIGNASDTVAGAVTTGTQTFAGVKTFNDNIVLAAGDSLILTGDTSLPGSPTDGQLFHHTSNNQLYIYTNGKWQADRTDAILVAASDSSDEAKRIADYVADGTGDQTEINSALTDANPAGSGRKLGKVFMFPGTYTISASIVVPNYTILAGAGDGTVVQLANLDTTVDAITDANATNYSITIRDFLLDGRDDLNTAGNQNGIALDSITAGSTLNVGARIEGMYVRNFRNAGIAITNSVNSQIVNNHSEGNGEGVYLGTSEFNTVLGNTLKTNAAGVYLNSANKNTVSSNVMDNNNTGIVVNTSSNNTLNGNIIEDATSYGIELTSANTNTITNNSIINPGNTTTFNAISLTTSDANSIVGNVLTDSSCTSNCYAINISNSGSDNNYLADNTYFSSGSDQARINDAGTNTRFASQMTPSQILQSGSTLIKASATIELTGDIDPDGDTTPPGTSTRFTTELQVGDRIDVNGEIRTVTVITNDTTITVDTAFSNGANDTTPNRLPASFRVVSSSSTGQFIIQDNGYVGIGTNAPTVELDVVGAGKFSGTLVVTGTTSLNGAVNLGDATSDDIVFNGYVASHVLPKTNDTYDLGDDTHRFKDLYLGGDTLHIGTSTSDEGAISYNTTTNVLNLQSTGTINAASSVTFESDATITGTLALKKGSDYSTTGASNAASFGSGSLIRLTGASTQTINGIDAGTDGRILALVNAAGQAATIANDSGSAPDAADRIITGTGSNLSVAAGATIYMTYDSSASRWRVVGSSGAAGVTTVGTFSGSSIANGASISGSTITFGPADGTNPGMVTTGSQTFAGDKTFTGLLQGTGGMTITGNTSIGATAGNTTGIGNTTGALTFTGSNTSSFILNGITVSAAEFNLLDGHNVALIDTDDAVNTAITGVGTLGSLTVSGASVFNGTVTLGDATGDDIVFNGYVASSIIPKTNDTYDLGTDALRWKDLYLGGETLHIGTSTSDEGAISYNTTTNVLNLQSTGSINFASDVTFAAGKYLTVNGGTTATRNGLTGTEGMIFYDTDTDRLLTYANGKWQADRSEAILVAASNSSQTDKDAADYVADGTGDQTEINNALTAAAPGGSDRKTGKVYLFPGTYVANATILVPNNTTLAGAGTGTVIELANLDTTENLIENSDISTGTGIVIRNLKLDGRDDLNTAGTQNGVVLTGMGDNTTYRAGAQITDVLAEDFRDDAVLLDGSDTNLISNSSFYSSFRGVHMVNGSIYNNVNTSFFKSHQASSVEFDNSDYNSITGSTIKDGNTAVYFISGADSGLVTGNNIEGSTYGVLMQGGSNHAASGNTISAVTYPIFVYAASNSSVTGNSISGGSDAIQVYSGTYNQVTGNSVTGATRGIYIASTAHYNNVSSNRIHNSGGATANNAIYVDSSDYNSIVNNNITDTSCTTTCYAINISDSGSDNNYVGDNTYRSTSGTDQSTINDAGTGTRYASQLTPAQVLMSNSSLIKATASSTLTGTADPAASTTLPGSSTKFLTELQIGDRITVNAETRTVTAIASDTSLTVDTAFTDTASASVTRLPASLRVLSSSNTSQILVQDNGNVGIGTTAAPSQLFSVGGTTGNFTVATTGAVTAVGVNAGAGLLQGQLGLTITGAAVSLNDSSNFNTTINTGTSTGTVTIGNTLSGAVSVQSSSTVGVLSGTTGTGFTVGNTTSNPNVSFLGSGTFGTTTGNVSLNGDTTVATGKTLTVTGTGATTLGGSLTVTGTVAFQKGADFSTTGPSNAANFGVGSLIRLTGATTQTINGIDNGVDGRLLTLSNVAGQSAIITNNSGSASPEDKIITGTGSNITLETGSSLQLVYDSSASLWRVTGTSGGAGTGSGVNTVGTFSGSSIANGASITGNTITFGPADGTNPGMVTTGTQTLAGDKTLTGNSTFTGTLLQKSNSATAILQQDSTGTHSNLLFDATTNKLRVYNADNAGGNANAYVEMYFDNASSTGVFASSTGTTQVGSGTGNIAFTLSGAADVLTGTKTSTLSGAYGGLNDYTFTRNITGGSNTLDGNIFKIEDTSAKSSGTLSSTLLYLNQQNTTTGNLILAQSGGSVDKFKVDYSGNVTAAGGLTVTGNTSINGTGSGTTTIGNTSGGTVAVIGTTNVNTTGTSTTTIGNSSASVVLGGSTSVSNGRSFTVGTGSTFTNNSSTVNTAIPVSNVSGGGNIPSGGSGTTGASTTVDIGTTFDITQTTTSQTLTLPTPNTATSGRMVYVNNTGSASFTMYGIVIAPSTSAAFIWNGSAWKPVGDGGITTIGTFSGSSIANGASISGSTLTFGPADATNPGMVTTGTQTFAGDKTFTGSLLQKVSSSTGFLLQDSGGTNNNLLFDSSTNTNKLRVYNPDNVGGNKDAYVEMYYDDTADAGVLASSSGILQLGTGAGTGGNINMYLSTISDKLQVKKGNSTISLAAAYTDSDFIFTRNFNTNSYASGGKVFTIEDITTLNGGSISPTLLYINQNTSGASGYLIQGQTLGSTNQFLVDVSGNVDINGVYKVDGTSGDSDTCSGGQFLLNQVTLGGITTAGTCTAYSLQTSYDSGASITTSSARDILFTLADSATDSNFQVNIASGSGSAFTVTSNSVDVLTVNSSAVMIGAQADATAHSFAAGCNCLTNSLIGTFGATGSTVLSRNAVNASVVYKGKLFVSVKETDLGAIYRYDGGSNPWTLVTNAPGKARSDDTNTTIDSYVMVVFNDTLYIGSQNTTNTGALYSSTTAHTTADSFSLVQATRGTFGSGLTTIDGISDLVVYKSRLYLATQEANLAEVDRYDGGTTLTQVSNTTEGRLGLAIASTTVDSVSFAVWQGRLFAAQQTGSGGNAARVAVYGDTGATPWFVDLTSAAGTIGAETLVDDITSIAVYNNELYVSTGEPNAANIYRWDVPVTSSSTVATDWEKVNSATGKVASGDTANLIDSNILRTYNGRLYAGSSNPTEGTAALYEYDSFYGSWSLMHATRGDFNGNTGVDTISMMQEFNGTMYIGVEEADEGAVYTWTKTESNSYALRFDSGNSNYGAFYFVGTEQVADNFNQHGTFRFTHSVSLTSGAFDYAEDYPTLDSSLLPGEPVAVDPDHADHVKRAEKGESVLGVVSENPGLRLTSTAIPESGAEWVPVALVGRVPVLVTTYGGTVPIAAGDTLALSNVPGILEKLSPTSGAVVGTALDDYTAASDGKVSMYVQPGIKEEPKVQMDKWFAAMNDYKGVDVAFELGSDGRFVLKNPEGEEVIAFDSEGNAKFAGTITADKIAANSIEGLDLIISRMTVRNEANMTGTADNVLGATSDDETNETADAPAEEESLAIDNGQGVNILTLADIETQGGLVVNKDARFNGKSTFMAMAEFYGAVTFKDEVSFEKSPTLSGDNGGKAIIKKDANVVTITFEQEYVNAPIVSASFITEDTLDNDGEVSDSSQAKQQRYLDGGYTYFVSNVTTKGFTLVLNKQAGEDLNFNWLATAISNVRISESTLEQINGTN